VFAGVAIAAGPSLGGGVGLGADAAAQCRTHAGEHADALDTQLVIAYASADDGIVAPNQAELNAAMFEAVYAEHAIASAEGMLDIGQFAGQMPTGEIAVWYDAIAPRVLHVTTTGAGHAWPGGTGTAGTYVYGGGIDFGRFLGEFFADNNLRVPGNVPGGGPWGDPPGGGEEPGGGSSGGGDSPSGTEGGEPPEPTSSEGGEPEPGSSDDAEPGDADGGTAPPPAVTPMQVDPSGCQCTSSGSGSLPLWIVAAFALRLRRRRR
jgi:MYXO-CTERM domain-containing protein